MSRAPSRRSARLRAPQPSAELSLPRRAALRRRLRYLRSLRELQLRDLGGLVFDLHRFRAQRHQLVLDKLSALRATDAELRDLERAVGDPRVIRELREPGIGGNCPRCADYHASDASFCANCGTALGDGAPEPVTNIGAFPPRDRPAPAVPPDWESEERELEWEEPPGQPEPEPYPEQATGEIPAFEEPSYDDEVAYQHEPAEPGTPGYDEQAAYEELYGNRAERELSDQETAADTEEEPRQ